MQYFVATTMGRSREQLPFAGSVGNSIHSPMHGSSGPYACMPQYSVAGCATGTAGLKRN